MNKSYEWDLFVWLITRTCHMRMNCHPNMSYAHELSHEYAYSCLQIQSLYIAIQATSPHKLRTLDQTKTPQKHTLKVFICFDHCNRTVTLPSFSLNTSEHLTCLLVYIITVWTPSDCFRLSDVLIVLGDHLVSANTGYGPTLLNAKDWRS